MKTAATFAVNVRELPDWANLTILPAGTWRHFTTNTPGDAETETGATDAPRQHLINYNGGTWATHYGTMGAVICHGGGEHGPWVDTGGVTVLDVGARRFRITNVILPANTGVALGPAGGLTDIYGNYQGTEIPQQKHTYNCISYQPPSMGGGPQGSLIRIAHNGGILNPYQWPVPLDNYGLSATYRFDLSQTFGGISRLTGNQRYWYPPAGDPSVNPARLNLVHGCVDLIRQGWWSNAGVGGGQGNGFSFTSKTGLVTNDLGPKTRAATYMHMHHFPEDDVLVGLTGGEKGDAEIWTWKPTAADWISPPLSGDIDPNHPTAPLDQLGVQGPQYASDINAFVSIMGPYQTPNSPTIVLKKITVPPAGQRQTGTWHFENVTLIAAPGETEFLNLGGAGDESSATLICGKMCYCPAIRAMVYPRGVNTRGIMLRLPGM